MNQEERDRIIGALNERGVTLPCSRCGNNNFTLIDGYFNHTFQPQLNGNVILGGPSIPSVGVVCSRCGLINYHAVGALGLLPSQTTPLQNGETQ